VGKDRTTVSNALRLLKMPDSLKAAVLNETISEGHARALMQIADEKKQNAMLKHVMDSGMSVRQTEEAVRRANISLREEVTEKSKTSRLANRSSSVPRHPSFPDTHSIEEELRRALGTKVELYRSQRGGKIIIEFYSDEELETIYEKLVG
jgi:ParB family chromosome partitioning protein